MFNVNTEAWLPVVFPSPKKKHSLKCQWKYFNDQWEHNLWSQVRNIVLIMDQIVSAV